MGKSDTPVEVINDDETQQQQKAEAEDKNKKKNQNQEEEEESEEDNSEEESEEDDDDEEEEDEEQGNQNNAGDAGDAADGEDNEKKEISPEEKIRINYYKWMFFFFFFHFFTFIVSTDILNEFSVYLEDETLQEDFNKKYGQIIPTLNALLSFNILVLLGFVAAFLLTFRYTMKIFYLFLAGYISLYLGKLICSFMAITIEPEMNDLLSKWYEEISEDEDQKYCGTEDYNRCRITFAWNFFKYEVIFDVCATTLTYIAYLYRVRKYKILLLEQLEKEYQQVEAQSKVSIAQKPNNLDMEESLNNITRNNDRSVLSGASNNSQNNNNGSQGSQIGSGVQN